MAKAYRKLGRVEEVRTALTQALAVVHTNGEQFLEADLYRLKGTLTLQSKASLRQVQDHSKTSLGQVRDKPKTSQKLSTPTPKPKCVKAIEIAPNSSPLELRATVSLARLWQQQGKRQEAHEMLAEISGWFTEGVDTKDLQEAKALLEELS